MDPKSPSPATGEWHGLDVRLGAIRLLEELAINAQPALETILLDGWVLRFSQGYTKRANSVHPLYAGGRLNLQNKIRSCETQYSMRSQPTIFKLAPGHQPTELEQVLDQAGYKPEPGASVQLLRLDNVDAPVQARVTLSTTPSERWLEAFCRYNAVQERFLPVLRQMLHSIPVQMCLAGIHDQGSFVAVGLGVLDQGFMGIFDVVTDPLLRRRGFGHQLLLYLLNWGRANSAHSAYLQVMPENEPAIGLYEKLGFRELYRYSYRVKW